MPLVPPTPHTQIHIMHLEVQKSTANDGKQSRGLGTWLSKTGMWINMHSKITYFTGLTSITYLLETKYRMLTYDVYGVVLVWKHPNPILTQDYGTIEVCSGIDCCS